MCLKMPKFGIPRLWTSRSKYDYAAATQERQIFVHVSDENEGSERWVGSWGLVSSEGQVDSDL